MVIIDTSSIELRVNLNGRNIRSGGAETRPSINLMRLPPLHWLRLA